MKSVLRFFAIYWTALSATIALPQAAWSEISCELRFGKLAESGLRALQGLDRILSMSAKDFANSAHASRVLFESASEVSNEMRALAEQVAAQLRDGKNLEVHFSVKLKRPTPSEFKAAVIQKLQRRRYDSVGQVSDLARGRIDLPSGKKLAATVKMIEDYASRSGYVVEVEPPRRPIAGKPGHYGYPRYHVNIKRPDGMQFEWQIGARSTSYIWERKGIPIPANLRLPPGVSSDIHDIEYRVFQAIWKKAQQADAGPEYAALERELGLKKFSDEVDSVAAESILFDQSPAELNRKVDILHRKAGALLQAIVQKKGPRFVEALLKAESAH